jgi:hypothetical protein
VDVPPSEDQLTATMSAPSNAEDGAGGGLPTGFLDLKAKLTLFEVDVAYVGTNRNRSSSQA